MHFTKQIAQNAYSRWRLFSVAFEIATLFAQCLYTIIYKYTTRGAIKQAYFVVLIAFLFFTRYSSPDITVITAASHISMFDTNEMLIELGTSKS